MRYQFLRSLLSVLFLAAVGAVSAQGQFVLDNDTKLVMSGNVQVLLPGTNLKTGLSEIQIGAGTLTVGGALQGPGTYAGTANASLILNGTGNGTLRFTPGANIVANLALNRLSSTVTLGNALTIAQLLNLQNGVLTSTAANLPTVGTSGAATGNVLFNTGLVNGPLRRWLGTTVGPANDFPVGNSTTLFNSRIEFTQPLTTAGTLTAEWINTPPGAAGLPLTDGLVQLATVNNPGFWRIDAGNGLAGGLYRSTFSANGFPGITDINLLRTVKRPSGGGSWTLDGVAGINGGSLANPQVVRNGMAGFSEFGIAAGLYITTTTVQTQVNPPVYGQMMTITATVTSAAFGAGVPQGTITFTDGGNPIAGCVNVLVTVLGNASCSVNSLGAGVNKVIGAAYSGNASYTASAGTTLQTINKAPLNVTASSSVLTYGDAAPVVTSAITGFVLGQNASALTTQPVCSTTYTQGASAAGSQYPTSCSGGVASNYSFNYINGTVTVNKKALTVTADNKTRAYGAVNPALTATFTGFVPGENFANSGITGSPLLGTTATASSPVAGSPYPITVGVGTLASANYSFTTFVNGTLTITQAQLTVTADNKARLFGAANPPLTFQITGFQNGETLATSGVTGTPSISTSATTASSPGAYAIGVTLGSLTAPNYGFTLVGGTLTISQAATTTVITNAAALGTSTTVGQSYPVTWTTTPVAPGAGTPTGTVTVSDGTGATCTAPVAAGTCNLTSTTIGTKTITASYPGDANFTGSVSQTVQHTVIIGVTGNVKQFVALGTNTNLAGVTITISGSANGQVVTDANGNYSFGLTTTGGSYTLTASGLGKTYDPLSRSYTNVTNNISNADFTAYDQNGPNVVPRELRILNTVGTPGLPVTVPVELQSLGNETSIAFSINYDNALLGIPTITCGTGAPNCAVTINNSLPGKAGITIVPTAAIAAGTRQVARLTFPTSINTATSTPVSFGDIPTVRDVRSTENNPLLVTYRTGFVSFTADLEGDVVSAAGTAPGGDGVLSNDVTVLRQMVLGLIVPTAGQYRNADSAPRSTLGDGCPINATDVTQAARYNLGLDAPTPAGGPTAPIPGGCGPNSRSESPDSPDVVGRIIRAVNTNANAGQTITVSFQLDSQGDEASASFSANWNPAVLTYVSSAAGTGVPTNTNLGLNTTQTAQGRLGVLLDSTNTYAQGTRQILTVTFTVAANAAVGVYPITFSSVPTAQSVSSAQGALLATTYETGSVTIGATAAGVTVSGRVTTAGGQALRNATVVITDSEGNRRTVTTGSFGIYTFEDVEAGQSYVIGVQAKRFRFASRVVNVTDSLADVNFVGQE